MPLSGQAAVAAKNVPLPRGALPAPGASGRDSSGTKPGAAVYVQLFHAPHPRRLPCQQQQQQQPPVEPALAAEVRLFAPRMAVTVLAKLPWCCSCTALHCRRQRITMRRALHRRDWRPAAGLPAWSS